MSRVPRANTQAFSVLELIVALTLSMVLMAAVWSMFNLFTRRESVDRARVDRIQLVRGFHQILTADLARLAPQGEEKASPFSNSGELETGLFPEPKSRKSNQLPRRIDLRGQQKLVSLRGTNTRLEILVFKSLTAPPFSPAESSRLGQSSQVEKTLTQPAFESVSYDWRGFEVNEFELDEQTSELEGLPAEVAETQGLYRRESSPEGSSQETREQYDFGTVEGNVNAVFRQDSESLAESDMPDEYAPEFVQLRFTYFDGRAWRDSWDSSLAKQFPAAIRVEFDLETNPKKREKLAEDWTEEGPDPAWLASEDRRVEAAAAIEGGSSATRFGHSFVISIPRQQLARTESSANLPLKRDPNRRREEPQ